MHGGRQQDFIFSEIPLSEVGIICAIYILLAIQFAGALDVNGRENSFYLRGRDVEWVSGEKRKNFKQS